MNIRINENDDDKCRTCGADFCTCEEEIELFNASLSKCVGCQQPILVDVEHTYCKLAKKIAYTAFVRQIKMVDIRRRIQQRLAELHRNR